MEIKTEKKHHKIALNLFSSVSSFLIFLSCQKQTNQQYRPFYYVRLLTALGFSFLNFCVLLLLVVHISAAESVLFKGKEVLVGCFRFPGEVAPLPAAHVILVNT
jgi:hypothetical protein